MDKTPSSACLVFPCSATYLLHAWCGFFHRWQPPLYIHSPSLLPNLSNYSRREHCLINERDGQPENLNKLLNSSKKVLVGISWNLCTNLREMVVLVVGKLLVSKHSFSPCIWELRKYIGSLFIVKCIPVFLFYLLCVCYLIWAFFPLYFLLNIVGIYGTSWVYNFILPPPLYWFFICSKLF